MTSSQGQLFTPSIANRFVSASGPIPYDASTTRVTWRDYSPSTSSATILGVPAYNGLVTRFSLSIQAGTRLYLDKSFIRLRLQLVNDVAGAIAAPTVTEGCGWNSLNCLSAAEYQLSNGVTVSRIDQQLGTSTQAMYLMTWTRDAMERASHRFITPCIESALDLGAALSAETQARSLSFVLGGVPVEREFMVPLSDLFPELGQPVVWSANKLDLSLTVLPADALTFRTAASINLPRLLVRDIQLCVYQAELTAEAAELALSQLKPGETLLRLATVYPDARRYVYAPSPMSDQSVSNVLGVLNVFPASTVSPLAVNPFQWTLNATSFQAKLGTTGRQPEDRLVIDPVNRALNTRLFTMYQQVCKRVGATESRLLDTALSYPDMQSQPVAGLDVSPYGAFWGQFFDEGAAPHRSLDPLTLEVRPEGGVAVADAVVVRFRVKYITLSGTYAVSIIE